MLYGAKCLYQDSLAVITGIPEHALKGRLLCWPRISTLLVMQEADRLMGYDASQPQKQSLRRDIARVVKKNGDDVAAFWYFKMLNTSEYHPSKALLSAATTDQIHSRQHLQLLMDNGLLGKQRKVIIRAYPYNPLKPIKPGQKVLHFIRIGQAYHNLLADLYREMGRDFDRTGDIAFNSPWIREEVRDAPITDVGRKQALNLHFTHEDMLSLVQMVVVSPLTRSVQTALAVFGRNVQSKAVPLIAHPDVTETRGLNLCNKRLPLSELRITCPNVDWSLVQYEEDIYWTESRRESPLSVSERCYKFMLWIRQRKEQNIAVVTHAGWLFTLLNTVLTTDYPHLQKWFKTGEIRVTAVISNFGRVNLSTFKG
eukprot:g16471.t1